MTDYCAAISRFTIPLLYAMALTLCVLEFQIGPSFFCAGSPSSVRRVVQPSVREVSDPSSFAPMVTFALPGTGSTRIRLHAGGGHSSATRTGMVTQADKIESSARVRGFIKEVGGELRLKRGT